MLPAPEKGHVLRELGESWFGNPQMIAPAVATEARRKSRAGALVKREA